MKLPKIYANVKAKGTINMTLSVNPLGCSPAALKRLKRVKNKDISLYPNYDQFLKLISIRFNTKPANFVLGNGSEQLIKLVCQTFLDEGDLVLVPKGSFPLFTKEANLTGAKTGFLEELSDANPELIFIANPQTPTGEVVGQEFLINLTKQFPKAILVVDEANGEFNNKSFIQEALKRKNCIVLRTFSKVLGLAGLRMSFAIGPKNLIKGLQTAQQPFPVTSLSLLLAQEAMRDTKFLNKTLKFVKNERQFLQQKLETLDFTVSNSVTNNLFISGDQINLIQNELTKSGVSVIDNTFFPGLTTRGFRISIKDKKTNRAFIAKITAAVTHVHSSLAGGG